MTDSGPSDEFRFRSKITELKNAGATGDELLARWKEEWESPSSIDHVTIIRILSDDDFWRWRPVIDFVFDEAVLCETTTRIAVELVDKYGGLSHIFPFEESLKAKAAEMREPAKDMVLLALSLRSHQASRIAAILSAGIARKDFEWTEIKISEHRRSHDPTEQTYVLMTATYLIRQNPNASGRLGDLILKTAIPLDECVQVEYCAFLGEMHSHDRERTEQRLVEILAKARTHRVTWHAIQTVYSIDDLSIQTIERALELTKAIEENDIRQFQALLLVKAYSISPSSTLQAIHETLETRSVQSHFGSWGNYLFEEIGGLDRNSVFKAIDSWMDDPSYFLAADCVEMLESAFSKDHFGLVDAIRHWKEPKTPRFLARMRVLADLISKRLDVDDDLVKDKCVEEIFLIAGQMKIDQKSVIAGEEDPVFQALMLADSILSPIPEVDYNQLFANLDLIPHVRDFVGIKWYEECRERKAKGNPLLHMFDRKPPLHHDRQNLVYPRKMLPYWETVFKNLDPLKPGMADIRKDLRRYNRPGDMLCELEIIGPISRIYRIRIRRKAKGLRGEFDLQVSLSEQSPILEVYNPQPPREVLYAPGTHGLDTQRNKMKVISKVVGKLDASEGIVDYPYVLVIFTTGLDFFEDDIHDIFYGSERLTILFDKTQGKAVEMNANRAKDSIIDLEPRTTTISGILLCRRNFTDFDDPLLVVRYYANPGARHPLTSTSVAELCEAISPVWHEPVHSNDEPT